MTVVISGTTGITNDGGYTGDGVVFADTTPANTLVTTTGGLVGIGTSLPAQKLDVAGTLQSRNDGATNDATVGAYNFYNTNASAAANPIRASIVAGRENSAWGAYLDFYTSTGTAAQVRAARIDSSGNLLVGTTSSRGRVTAQSTSADESLGAYRTTSSTGAGVFTVYSDVGGTGAAKFQVTANGAYATLSDATLKKNIEPSRSYLADVMQLRVVKYNWLTDEDGAAKELGWVAQEVEAIFPGLVSNTDGGQKMLKKEVFLPMLMKCIQEQQALIESLTARVAALDARLTSLEGTQP